MIEDESKHNDEKSYVAAFAYQQGGSMSVLPYGEKISPPLLSSQKTAVLIENHSQNCRGSEVKDDVCPTLTAAIGTGGNNTPFVIENPSEDTVTAFGEAARDYKDPPIVVKAKSIVRRLTPLECERLQGFPDSWTEGESDSARYKALGNSVALPCVDYIMSGIADLLDTEINNYKIVTRKDLKIITV